MGGETISGGDPAVGDRILWKYTTWQVTRVGMPTFPGGSGLVYARPLGGGPESFIPAGQWARLAVDDPEESLGSESREGNELWQMIVARDVLASLLRDEMATTGKLTSELERLRKVNCPVTPLPNKPGAVGTATVAGVEGVRVMFSPDGDEDTDPWFSCRAIKGVHWWQPADLSDYVPLLDGQDQ